MLFSPKTKFGLLCLYLGINLVLPTVPSLAQAAVSPKPAVAIDHDLMEVTVDGLHRLYAQHLYTATQVTQWYLDRIAKYDGTYHAMLYVDSKGALARAAEEDASPASVRHGALWG